MQLGVWQRQVSHSTGADGNSKLSRVLNEDNPSATWNLRDKSAPTHATWTATPPADLAKLWALTIHGVRLAVRACAAQGVFFDLHRCIEKDTHERRLV
jgi:hypothetical protein